MMLVRAKVFCDFDLVKTSSQPVGIYSAYFLHFVCQFMLIYCCIYCIQLCSEQSISVHGAAMVPLPICHCKISTYFSLQVVEKDLPTYL